MYSCGQLARLRPVYCYILVPPLCLSEDGTIWFMQCLNDGTPEVRDAAFLALAAVAKVALATFDSYLCVNRELIK